MNWSVLIILTYWIRIYINDSDPGSKKISQNHGKIDKKSPDIDISDLKTDLVDEYLSVEVDDERAENSKEPEYANEAVH